MADTHTSTTDLPAGTPEEPITVAFVCVQNAGRSQMAAAFAERERDRRGLGERIDVRTGGTDPADHVHEEVVVDPDRFYDDRRRDRRLRSRWQSCCRRGTR